MGCTAVAGVHALVASSSPCEGERARAYRNASQGQEYNDAHLTSTPLEAKDFHASSIDQIIQGKLQFVFQLNF